MVSEVLVEMIKSGAIAFVGSRITKALNQKEISEFIAGAGWCAVGGGTVRILSFILKPLKESIDKTSATIDKIDGFFDKMGAILDKVEGIFGK